MSCLRKEILNCVILHRNCFFKREFEVTKIELCIMQQNAKLDVGKKFKGKIISVHSTSHSANFGVELLMSDVFHLCSYSKNGDQTHI